MSATAGSAVPLIHRKNLLGFRVACEQTWGAAGLARTIDGLPPAIREATAGLVPVGEWVPEAFIIAWFDSIWNGPAERQEAKMRPYVSLSITHGFGRVKKMLLGMITPEGIAPRAPGLWQGEHTTGKLAAEIVGPQRLRLELTDHVYTERPLLRLAIAESFRCIVGLTRARNVEESHPQVGKSLVVLVRWETSG